MILAFNIRNHNKSSLHKSTAYSTGDQVTILINSDVCVIDF